MARARTTTTEFPKVEDLRLLRTDEVAALLGVAPETLRAWRSQGRGPRYLKIGKDARYRPCDILDWQNRLVAIEPKYQ